MPQCPKSHKWVSRLEGTQTMPHANNNNKFDIKPAVWFSETVAGLLGDWYILIFKPLLQAVKTYWGDKSLGTAAWRFCVKFPVVLPSNQPKGCLLWAMCSLDLFSTSWSSHGHFHIHHEYPHVQFDDIHHCGNLLTELFRDIKVILSPFGAHRNIYLIRQIFWHVLQTERTQFWLAIGPPWPLMNHIQHWFPYVSNQELIMELLQPLQLLSTTSEITNYT